MEVTFNQQQNGILEFLFVPEDNDPLQYRGAKLRKTTCEVHLSSDWNIDKVHPDIMALVAILIIYPFTGPKITLPFGISRQFHDLFKQTTKKDILPIDEALKPRIAPIESTPSLAFSGGVDSTAALLLLPSETNHFFLDRIKPKDINISDLYKKEAAVFACESLKKEGKYVFMIKTDLEYIRDPVGFPVDVANAIPALLYADERGLDSISWGTTMQSTYRVGEVKYEDYMKRLHFRRWGKLFEIVGMPFHQVTGGICDVGTSLIVMNSPYAHLARSCIRGTLKESCHNCWKCFRRGLLEKTLKGHFISNSELDELFKINEAQYYLSKIPIPGENIISYITHHYKGDHVMMNVLKKRSRGDMLDVAWMEKWYSPSRLLLPDKYQSMVQQEIMKYLEIMSKEDEQEAEHWNLEFLQNNETIHQLSQQLKELFI
ncbi:DUF6395 domain-containing protein [Bacillus salitolerans]|uniref:DUF6395 domain-containing protein n=1 Tax=Bacillus salitolerans TaxID=1437434 RepID=A0ABW4LJU0_9BACI